MNKGFSLIETLIVVSIILLIGTIGFTNYFSKKHKESLQAVVNEIVARLELSRSKALIGEVPAGCVFDDLLGFGVVINTTSLISQYYCPTASNINTFDIRSYDKDVSIENAPITLYFKKVNGELEPFLDTDICVKHALLNVNKYARISISKFGVIKTYVNQQSCP